MCNDFIMQDYVFVLFFFPFSWLYTLGIFYNLESANLEISPKPKLCVSLHTVSAYWVPSRTPAVHGCCQKVYLFGKESPQIDSVTLSTDVWEYILISEQGTKQGGVVFSVSSSVTFMWQVVEESCQCSTQSI